MKALSVSQPWATAIASGLKKIETRSWAPAYRGRLVIHASARNTFYFDRQAYEVIYNLMPSANFEHGAIVAVATLFACVRTEEIRDGISERERLLGDYSDGRWAWLLHHVLWVDPVPCKGKLGLWTLPEDVEAALGRQIIFA